MIKYEDKLQMFTSVFAHLFMPRDLSFLICYGRLLSRMNSKL